MQIQGRLAPSPTGFLHLGNAWAFLLAWLAARASSGRILLRMEDIDQERSKKEFGSALMADLQWLWALTGMKVRFGRVNVLRRIMRP